MQWHAVLPVVCVPYSHVSRKRLVWFSFYDVQVCLLVQQKSSTAKISQREREREREREMLYFSSVNWSFRLLRNIDCGISGNNLLFC